MRLMFKAMAGRARAAASAIDDAVRQTHAARLAIMAARLRRSLPLLAMLIAATLLFCLFLGWSSGRSVFRALSPASPTGIGAGIAGVLAGLIVIELCAVFAITLMTAALQLAYDTGRHRVRALLQIVSAIALAGLAWRLSALDAVSLPLATIFPMLASACLVALTIWFERTYLRPAYPGFRDFWVDIVDARLFLTRAAHGE
ncbi:conserved membrane hypothetical protein [Hyphomicrobiales bacterium]|nr:conserved membrane hypothetical protein [Hyphomicrobiales bacterium]CAH1700612.1 conserved membrane hypothetical protein [Hyphomicrobiales bacterium]CAI0344460.1 conserved membrane hypothetical protein [Hyphomicrobiales bacterium]